MKKSLLGLLTIGILAVDMGHAQKSASPNPDGQSPNDKPLMQSLKGLELFQAYCATCHGREAKGGGPMAASLKTPPADLTTIAKRNKGTFRS